MNTKNEINNILLITVIFMAFFPAIILPAEEPVMLASAVQYSALIRYTTETKNIDPAGNTSPASDSGDFSSMSAGIDAASCSIFGDIPVIVEGPTEIEFWWRGSNSGLMLFILNGKIQAVQHKDSGWIKYKLTISKKGTHHLKWAYKPSAEKYASTQP